MPRALTLLLVLSAACSNATDSEPQAGDAPREQPRSLGSPIPPPPTLSLIPIHGSTNVTDAPLISISIQTVDPIERGGLEQLAGRASVVTWPDKVEVETQTSIGEGLVYRGLKPWIRLTPTQPLEPGWYALEVHSLVPPFQWPYLPEFERDGDAGRSRFKVGSEPVVVNIRVCAEDAARTKVLLDLSEIVAVIQPLEDHLTVESPAGEIDCEVSDQGPQAGHLALMCDFAGIKSVKVTLSGAFAELASPTLPAQGASAQFEFDPSALTDIGGNCKIYKPE